MFIIISQTLLQSKEKAMNPLTIYGIPVMIWEALGFGLKVGFLFSMFIVTVILITRDSDD